MRFNLTFEPFTGTIALEYQTKRYVLPLHLGYWGYDDYVHHWGYTTYDIIDEGVGIYYLLVSFFGPWAQQDIRAIEVDRIGDTLRLADRTLAGVSFKNVDMGKAYIQVEDVKKILPYQGEDCVPEMAIPLSLFYEWHFGDFQNLMRV